MSNRKECPECANDLHLTKNGAICQNCGWKSKPNHDNFKRIDRCVIAGCVKTSDLCPAGIKCTNGSSRVDWYCEKHYLQRVENMSKTSKDLSWCKADPEKVPNLDVIKSLVNEGEITLLLKSLIYKSI